MDQKQLIDAMEEIRHLAEKSQGMIKKTQVLSILKKHDFTMDESQMNFVYAYLKTAKVTVLEEDHTEVIVDAGSIEQFRTKAEEAEEADVAEAADGAEAAGEGSGTRAVCIHCPTAAPGIFTRMTLSRFSTKRDSESAWPSQG